MATVTVPVHGLLVGQTVVISGLSDTTFNGPFVVTGVPSVNSFTYANAGLNSVVGTTSVGTANSSVEIGSVNNKASTGGIATLQTANPHGFVPGQTIIVSIGDVNFDGAVVVLGAPNAPTATQFSFAKAVATAANAKRIGTTVTITTVAPHGFLVGSNVDVALTNPVLAALNVSATVLIFGNSRIAKIANLRFPLF